MALYNSLFCNLFFQPASPSMSLLNSSDVGARLSAQDIPDYVTIIDPPNGGQHKGNMFRRHRKVSTKIFSGV